MRKIIYFLRFIYFFSYLMIIFKEIIFLLYYLIHLRDIDINFVFVFVMQMIKYYCMFN